MHEGPIYTLAFVQAGEGSEGAFPVRDDENNETWLREAGVADLNLGYPFYVRVEHDLEYPYAAWDFEDVRTPLKEKVTGKKEPPVRYAEAAIVFSPKMKLIE